MVYGLLLVYNDIYILFDIWHGIICSYMSYFPFLGSKKIGPALSWCWSCCLRSAQEGIPTRSGATNRCVFLKIPKCWFIYSLSIKNDGLSIVDP